MERAPELQRSLVFPFTQQADGSIHEVTSGVAQAKRVYSPDGISRTLSASTGGGMESPKILVTQPVFPFTQQTESEIREVTKGVPQSQRVYDPEGISSTLRAQASGGADSIKIMVSQERIRRLTPVECERLQGFPDGWTEGVSDTARYKCCGNAVPTVLIEAVVFRLLEGWE